MFVTNLLRDFHNKMLGRSRSEPRHSLAGSRNCWNSSRALAVEPLEDRAMLTAYVVDTPLDNYWSAGPDDVDGLVSLREAVTAANTNAAFGDAIPGEGGGVVDEITFGDLLIGKTITLDSRQLEMSSNLSIAGPGADLLTVSGNSYSRVFRIWESTVTADLSGLTIADGAGVVGGAGIWNNGTLTVTDVALSENSTDLYGSHPLRAGGAIYNGGVLTITGSTISGNRAGLDGGGIYNLGSLTITDSTVSGNEGGGAGGGISTRVGMLIVSDCTLSGNEEAYGGGIYSSSTSTMTITDSTLSANSAGQGGGIYNGGTATITASTLSGNSASYDARQLPQIGGGGVFNSDFGMLTITDSTLSGNWAFGSGGGIGNTFPGRVREGGTVAITNSTLTGNRADADGNGIGSGGGVFNDPGDDRISASLHNSLIAGNFTGADGTPDEIPDDISTDSTEHLSGTHNLIGDAATSGGLTNGVDGNIVGNTGSGTIDIATVLDPNLSNNGGPTLTHALVPDSLALDAGDNNKAVDADGEFLVYDQRGEDFARVVDGNVDIGPFEVQPEYQLVQIDVKPGSDPDSVNLGSNGVIAVAILTTEDFDASRADASTVAFAGAGAVHSAREDIDGDGDLDMILHFRVQETNLADIYAQLLAEDINEDGVLDSNRQTAAISLIGETMAGDEIVGTDDMDLFFSGKALRELLEDLATAGVIQPQWIGQNLGNRTPFP